MDDVPGNWKKKFKIIHESPPVPRALELVRKDLDPKVKKKLKEILLNAPNNPEGVKALKGHGKTTKYDEIQGDVEKELNQTRQIYHYIREEIK